MTAAKTRRAAWVRLLRPPNLPTVPGDPLVGYLLAAAAGASVDWAVLWVMAAAAALYLCGLVLNDVADYEVDLRERPGRPLPSGAVTRWHGLIGGLAFGGCGVALASMAGPWAMRAAALVFILVLVYDFLMPRGTFAGIVVMGLCRAGSVGLGIAFSGRIAGDAAPWLAAAGTGLYIVAVSKIAAGEMRVQRLGAARWLPALALAATFAAVIAARGTAHWPGLLLGGFALAVTWNVGRRLGPEPAPAVVPPAIGGFIRALILVQASLCALTPGWGSAAALALLCLWPLSALLGRRFYGS
jgi:4-hydroxybenzoate polyprenyltransferase